MTNLSSLNGTGQEQYQLLQEYVHKLEEAICYFRWPMTYAYADQRKNEEYFATSLQARDSYTHRLKQGKPK
jgi:hypothetical protein